MENLMGNETIANLFNDLGISADHSTHSLRTLAAANSKYIKDLKLNVSSALASATMTRKETSLLALSVAVNEKCDVLSTAFENLALKEGATIDEIAETHGCASLMTVNNVFYRFRHFMQGAEYYGKQPAGLRMSMMMAPAMGKGLFELMSLVLSAVNGCEQCVVSHEHSVRQHGADEPRVYDAIRLGAVIKGLCTVM
jgi:alkyl hydroperoxide reductase subunit D